MRKSPTLLACKSAERFIQEERKWREHRQQALKNTPVIVQEAAAMTVRHAVETLNIVQRAIVAEEIRQDAVGQFVEQIARLTKDGECSTCREDGDTPNPDCRTHGPFDLESDDAVETLHGLISQARALVDGEAHAS